MNLNQVYNKHIIISLPQEPQDPVEFDLIHSVYHGKLTRLADVFNKQSVQDTQFQINNKFDKDNYSPLQIASFLGYTNIFMYLLTYNSEVYHINSNGNNIFHLLAYRGDTKILYIILNWERFCNKLISIQNVESINKSHGFSRLDIIKGKLSKGVNLTETNVKRFNSLQVKLREESAAIIDRNIQKFKCWLLVKDKEGRTPMHYAAMSKYSLCYLIVNNICDFEFLKLDGWNEFLQIFSDTQDLEVKPEREVDPRKCLRLEKELEHYLGESITKELVLLFKKKKRELLKNAINIQDNQGDTVLHIAAFHGDYRIVNKLLAYGADKNERNLLGKLPVDIAKDDYVRRVLTNLNKAAKNSDVKSMTELVHFGHDINSKKSIFSQAPIHKVVESTKRDKYEVLKKVLDMGADPSIKDSNGWTAM